MKTLLHIGPNGAQYWQKGQGGWQLLTQAPPGPVWAVTDLAEESFVEIQIPRIFARDRADFVARQLASRFPDTPFRAALPTVAAGSLMDRLAPPRQQLLGVDAAERIQTALDAQRAPLVGLWASSMLLALLGRHKQLPPELFIVVPSNGALRIVFLKNRQPVLTRLVPSTDQPTEQAGEIVRTLRHLENTRAVERSERRYAVLMLGPETAGLAAPLAAQRLDLVALPPPWHRAPPQDWRFALFDLALTSPIGQLAPVGQRSAFLARRLRRTAYAVAAGCFGLTLWVVSGQFWGALEAQRQRDQAQVQLRQLNTELARTEQSISRFGVAPDLLRRVVNLDAQELALAPALADTMSPIANIVSRSAGHRVSRLNWRVLSDTEPACTKGTPAPTGEPAPVAPAAAPSETQRRVELDFDLALAAGTAPRERARALAQISSDLARVVGATVLRDPTRNLGNEALSSSSLGDTQTVATWCLTLTSTGATPQPSAALRP